MTRFAGSLALGLILLAGVTAGGTSASTAPGPQPNAAASVATTKPGGVGQLAPLVFQGLRSPIPFRGSDGKTHLAYAVTIQNAGPVPVKINRISVLNAKTGRVFSSVSSDNLDGRLGLLATPIVPLAGATLGSSQAAVYWVDATLPARAAIPKMLKHRITATPIGDSFYKGRETVTAAPLKVSPKEAGPFEAAAHRKGMGRHHRMLHRSPEPSSRTVLGSGEALRRPGVRGRLHAFRSPESPLRQ